MASLRLIGFFKSRPDLVPGFLIPLFLGPDSELCVVKADENDCVSEFVHVRNASLLNVSHDLTNNIYLDVKEPALHAFRFADGTVKVLPREDLKAALRANYVPSPEQPILEADVHRFLGDRASMIKALRRVVELERAESGDHAADRCRRMLAQQYEAPELA
jgi:hypothetical protein